MGVKASCLDCAWTGESDRAATRHCEDTLHSTTTGLIVTGSVCTQEGCEHRHISHAYVSGRGNVGMCLAPGCECGAVTE